MRGGILLLLSVALLWPVRVMGEPAASPDKQTQDTTAPIHISAESLMADDLKKYAEFIGQVRAVQGGTVITSDRLRLYYEGNPDSTDTTKAGTAQGGIKKIVATGSVRIEFDDMVAEGQEAVYTTGDRVLVLSGPDARVIREKSGTVSGSKITVHRDDGRIKFEGGVTGVFYPGEKGLD
ncbi:lipopolysaccharide transport periplasmic protein LptA [Desulfonema ishimotonii]|uniref:Lipopolysaccharide transport periplasmic protein LptA n=1 Tax=Desulfonema ishimotonii TaxID=45657 RepID=A0A401G0A0_9BACT|nr:LptA/OstA family protein [Desulfonema ishimotonii]GBC62627.1 lipopolysaccharide transport periplasmic protein LptA [Desulfonema ishimotonii]